MSMDQECVGNQWNRSHFPLNLLWNRVVRRVSRPDRLPLLRDPGQPLPAGVRPCSGPGAARATDPDAVALFARHASEAIEMEQGLHVSLLAGLGLSPTDVEAAGAGPTSARPSEHAAMSTSPPRPGTSGCSGMRPTGS